MSTGFETPKTPAGWAIWLVIVIAIIGCLYVMQQVAGIAIPQWIIMLALICLAAFFVILAIKFLASLGKGL